MADSSRRTFTRQDTTARLSQSSSNRSNPLDVTRVRYTTRNVTDSSSSEYRTYFTRDAARGLSSRQDTTARSSPGSSNRSNPLDVAQPPSAEYVAYSTRKVARGLSSRQDTTAHSSPSSSNRSRPLDLPRQLSTESSLRNITYNAARSDGPNNSSNQHISRETDAENWARAQMTSKQALLATEYDRTRHYYGVGAITSEQREAHNEYWSHLRDFHRNTQQGESSRHRPNDSSNRKTSGRTDAGRRARAEIGPYQASLVSEYDRVRQKHGIDAVTPEQKEANSYYHSLLHRYSSHHKTEQGESSRQLGKTTQQPTSSEINDDDPPAEGTRRLPRGNWYESDEYIQNRNNWFNNK
jgi:hypothetical protein